VSTADATLRTVRTGSFGVVDASVAAPLAMVLNELLQNAAEHGVAAGRGEIRVDARRTGGQLVVVVDDEGAGLPADFVDRSGQRMGLQIVRTLVRGELSGEIEFGERPGGGTRVTVRLPIGD
jgi:two-component sensor histidine kinase